MKHFIHYTSYTPYISIPSNVTIVHLEKNNAKTFKSDNTCNITLMAYFSICACSDETTLTLET
jgi:hypothetical protein